MNENSIQFHILSYSCKLRLFSSFADLHVFNFIFDEKSLVSLLDIFLNNDSPKGILFLFFNAYSRAIYPCCVFSKVLEVFFFSFFLVSGNLYLYNKSLLH